MKTLEPIKKVTLLDRLALAFAGAFFGALTLVGYAIAAAVIHPKSGVGLAIVFASPLGLAVILFCALAGALLGPTKLADFFGLLWGTDAFWSTERGRWLAVAIAIAIFITLLFLRAGNRGLP